MNKKLLSVSIFLLAFAMPAMADDIIPINPGYYLPANSTSVALCTSGNFCPGVETNYDDNTPHVQSYDQGLNQCPTGFGNSISGASINTQCYRACDIANMGDTIDNIANATSLIGRDYYGTTIDTCKPETCEDGYYVNIDPDLNAIIGTDRAVKRAYVRNDGLASTDEGTDIAAAETYGLTSSDRNAFAVDFGDSGLFLGHGRCSTQSGIGFWNGASVPDDVTIHATLTDETGQSGAVHCYCKLDSYTPSGDTEIPLSAYWMYAYHYNYYYQCAYNCAITCASYLGSNGDSRWTNFRYTLLTSLELSAFSCTMNTITINWTGASDDAISANDAGQCTYNGDIHTPQSATPVFGKTFKGWRFVRP